MRDSQLHSHQVALWTPWSRGRRGARGRRRSTSTLCLITANRSAIGIRRSLSTARASLSRRSGYAQFYGVSQLEGQLLATSRPFVVKFLDSKIDPIGRREIVFKGQARTLVGALCLRAVSLSGNQFLPGQISGPKFKMEGGTDFGT